jgi:hypothetical protein
MNSLGSGQMEGLCQQINKHSGCIKCLKFPEWPGECWLIKMN